MSHQDEIFYTIDIGCNFAGKHYQDKKHLPDLIEMAYESGVDYIISISNSIKEIGINKTLVSHYKQLYFTAGCHPHDAKLMTENDYQVMLDALTDSKCLAVGKCGLDFDRMYSPKEKQIEVFEKQIQIAVRTNKPLYLYYRGAYPDFLRIIRKYNYYLGVIHCFNGTLKQALELVDLGFYLSICGILLNNEKNHDLIQVVKTIPLEKILVESDSPWLSIDPKRESVPTDTAEIVYQIAQIRGQNEVVIGKAIYTNTLRCFAIS